MSKKKQLVIIGGGFGGLTLAKSLKNSPFEILLIDKQNHHLFQPLLYQVATAQLSAADIAMPLREIFKKNPHVSVLMGEVIGIDRAKNQIILSNQETFDFDYLVIATGAKHSYFGHPEWESFAPGLKTVQDALRIRDNLLISFEKAERTASTKQSPPPLNFVVIGGGPTGVEMAGAIAEICRQTLRKNFRKIAPEQSKVFLIEGLPRILPVYSEKLSARAKKDLEKIGVEVINNNMVTSITDQGVEIQGQFIPSSNIIWAAGNAASTLLKSLDTPLDRQGRALVKKDLSIPNSPHIFVIGDAACFLDDQGKPLPAIAPVAMQQARFLAKLLKKTQPELERASFHYFDKGSMATIGKAKAVASSFGFEFGGWIAWLAWCFLHIFYLIGFKNRISVMLQWFIHYFSGFRGARLISRSIEEDLSNDSKRSL